MMRRLLRRDNDKEHLVIDADEDKGKEHKRPCSCCPSRLPFCMPKRYQTAIMVSLGYMISLGMRCNLGVAIIAMTRNDTKYVSHANVNVGNGSYNVQVSAFDWNSDVVGTVESSYFWGYLFTQIPGGYLAARYPATRIFSISVVSAALLNLLIPGAVTIHYGVAMVARFLQGLADGVELPASIGIWRHWAPPLERSRLTTLSNCGAYIGIIIGMPVSGVLTDLVHWGASFYFYGGAGVLWFIAWWFVVSESPATCSSISEEERVYIENSIREASTFTTSKLWVKPPWTAFFRSLPVWAIIVANFCRSWTFFLMIVDEPAYFKDVYGYTVGQQGFLAALPHITMTLVAPIGGVVADLLQKQYLSTTTVRKLFNCGGFGLEATLLIAVAFISDKNGALIALIIGVGISGLAISGFAVNSLDIAPRYASIVIGISNTAGAIAGLLVPIVVAKITINCTREEWSIVFLVSASLHIVGVIFYAVFASGEQQPWAEPIDDSEETSIVMKESAYGTITPANLKHEDEYNDDYSTNPPTDDDALTSKH